MSQGRTSPNVPLQTDCLSDAQLEQREKMLRMAANPQTPSDSLRYLANSSDRLIRKTVVANPNTPREILFKLGAEFPDSLINNPVWELLFLENPSAIRDVPLMVKQHLLLQDEVPYYLMESITKGGNINLCLGLTRHPKTPQSILEKLFINLTIPVEAIQLHINWPDPPQKSIEEIIRGTYEHRLLEKETQWTLRSLAENCLLFDLIEKPDQETDGKWGRLSPAFLLTKGLEKIITPDSHKNSENPENHELSLYKRFKNLADYYHSKIQSYSYKSYPFSPQVFKVLVPLKTKIGVIPKKKPGISRQNHPFKSAIGYIVSQMLKVISSNPFAPNWLLYKLAIQNLWLCRKILECPKLSSSLLENLAMTQNHLVQREVARYPHTPESVLKLLAWVQDVEVRCNVARHPHTQPFELLLLAIDDAVKVRREIAKNPQTPQVALELLAGDHNVSVRLAVALHPNPPIYHLEALVNDAHYQVRNAAVTNSSTPLDCLKDLIGCRSSQGIEKVIAQLKIPEILLQQLVTDSDDYVREGMTFYPELPRGVVKQLSKDRNFKVRHRAMAHPNASVSILSELLCDRNLYAEPSHIYRSLASNYLKHKPQKLPFILKQLAEYSKDSFERLLVLLHPQVPPSALAQNWQSLDWLERYCIAQHPNTPLSTLEELTNDGNRVVRAVAREQLKQRQPPPPRRHRINQPGDQ